MKKTLWIDNDMESMDITKQKEGYLVIHTDKISGKVQKAMVFPDKADPATLENALIDQGHGEVLKPSKECKCEVLFTIGECQEI